MTNAASITGYGPGSQARAVVLTFDNLGEASALERRTWDPRTPVGHDPSVTRALPRLLDELDRHGLTGTFFVEAINCELNPDALREIAARGHELGVHGWRHEPWAQLDPRSERELLERSTAAFADLGVAAPRAFRPPGGGLTDDTCTLLRELGYAWCSPEGVAPSVRDGLATIPFSWDLVDAYHLMERFAALRRRRGDSDGPLGAEVAGERLLRGLAADGAHTLILHPFLMLDDAWWAGVRALLSQLAVDRGAWVVPGVTFARWLTR